MAHKRSIKLALFLAIFFALWTIRVIFYDSLDTQASSPVEKRMWSDGFRATLWLAFPLAWLSLVGGRSFMRPVELPKGWSPRLAVVAGLALIVVWVAIERATTGAWHHVPLGRPSNEYIAAGIGAVMVGVAEEFVFRGIVMGELWRRYGFWLANIGAAVLFAMIHWPGWVLLEHASLGSVLASSGYLFLFGLVMGGLAGLEGGIVMAAVVHGLNDLLVGAGFN